MLTYGRVKHPTVQPFRPDFVQNDKIILTFDGFFRQTVYEPYNQYDRIRNVKVMYFMEDDTIMVVEPPVMVDTDSQFYEIYEKPLNASLLFRIAAIHRAK